MEQCGYFGLDSIDAGQWSDALSRQQRKICDYTKVTRRDRACMTGKENPALTIFASYISMTAPSARPLCCRNLS